MAYSTNFLDDVKKELECPVCQEQFSDAHEPKILKCLHTFCETCLTTWLTRQQREGELSCPTCRHVTQCSDNDIKKLPSNLFYKQMVEIADAYSGRPGHEDSPHCGICDEKKALKFYCVQCNAFLCEDCAGFHDKGKVFKSHDVKQISNFKSNDVQKYVRRANVCKKHEDEVRYYCEKCNICICRDCALLEHCEHKRISLDHGLDLKKSCLAKRIQEVEAVGRRLQEQKAKLEKQRTRFNDSFDQSTVEIHRVTEHWINIICRHKETMIKELLKRKESFEMEFSAKMTNVNERLTDIKSSLEFGRDILERNNLPEILNIEETLGRRFEDFSSSAAFSGPIEMNVPSVNYVPNDMTFLEHELGKLVDPLMSMNQGKVPNSRPPITEEEQNALTAHLSETPHQAVRDKDFHQIAGVKEGKENTGATGSSRSPVFPRSVDKLFSESSIHFEIQPQFMKLLQKVHKNTISKMEQRFAVQIFWKENTSQVLVHPSRKTSNGNDSFKEGCDKFIDLYKNFTQNVSRNVIQLPSEARGEVIDKTISAFQEDNRAVCEREGDTVVLYAEKDISRSLDRAFKERLHSILESNRRGKITNQGSFNNQHLQSIPYSQPLGDVQLRNGVLFSLHHADITSVKVDAIVNAANEHLQHGGGVAAAIVRTGGRQIQHESNEIVKRLGPIPVGEAVETSGGRLPCQYVIHTVGPRWYEHKKEKSKSLLRQACLASLNLAAMRLHLSSIALTAISSGVFGMPKDICAQVIFKAVEEFSESEYAEVSCLRDVRIVIIDEPTIRVFYEEFIKRYCFKGALAEDLSNSGHPQDKEKQNSFILNPPEDVRKAQKNDSAGNGNQYSEKLKNNAKSLAQATTMNKEIYETDLSDGLMEMCLSNTNGKGNAESTSASDHMKAERKNFNLPSVKSASSGNESVTGMSAHGRGRGMSKFAPAFQKSPGGETDLTLTNAKSSAPGLIVTDEGKDLSKQFNDTKGRRKLIAPPFFGAKEI